MSDLAPDWISCQPKDIPRVTGIAYTRVREAIDAGELAVVYSSPKRQVVTRDALTAWLNSLPTERSA